MVLKSFFGKRQETAPPPAVTPPAPDIENTPAQEPEPAVFLEKAMVENARQDTPETRTKVFQELLFSDLLLAISEEHPLPTPQSGTEPNQTPSIHVAILVNGQGVHFASAFTSAASARRWRAEGGQYVSLRGQDLFRVLQDSPAEVIVVNPSSAPFIVLHKAEYKQLALGILPQIQNSPVHVSESPAQAEQAKGMQISFPPDAFSDVQRDHMKRILESLEPISAASLGAILPPGAPQDSGWLRTVFLKVSGIENKQEILEKFCAEIRDKLLENCDFFQNHSFEVGVMPDPNFWVAVKENKVLLLEKDATV